MAESQTTILVVDDEMTTLKRVEALLLPRQFRVLTALSGEEALRALHREPPDLVARSERLFRCDPKEDEARLNPPPLKPST